MHALALLVILVVTATLYWPALRCGLLSDGWALLYIGSQPLGDALATRLSYHFIPGTHLLNAILWRGLGLQDPLYQLVNLGELALVAGALYFVGRRLFPNPLVGFLAALLFVANPSFYEVPMWTGVGNFQSLTALLYLGGMFCAVRAADDALSLRSRAAWSSLFAVLGLAAVFTYEPAFSVLLVGVVAAATAGQPAGLALWRSWLRRAVAPGAAAAVAIAIVLGVKAHLASAGDPPLFLPQTLSDVAVRCLFLVRAVIGIFILRAHGHVVQRLTQLGLSFDLGNPVVQARLVGWLLAFAAVVLMLIWRGSAGVRLAAVWVSIHLGLVALSIVPQSRHYYLAALPAALLLAAGFVAAGERLARTLGSRVGAWAAQPAALALLPYLVLLPGAKADLERAAALYAEGTAATRTIRAEVQQRLTEVPALAKVNLVNLPAQVAGDGVSAHFFVNGMREMVELATDARVTRDRVKLMQTLAPVAGPAEFASGSQYITVGELDGEARDLSALTLLFDSTSRTFTRLRPTSWALPVSYLPSTAPFLPWRRETAEPYVQLTAEPLKLPIGGGDSEEWVAVRVLQSPGGDLRLSWTDGELAIPAQRSTEGWWTVAVLPAGTTPPQPLTLRTTSGGQLAGVWSFAPPVSYTPQTAPFLTWWLWDTLMFVVHEPLTLPLRGDACASDCRLRLEYQDLPDVGFEVAVDDGPPLTVRSSASAAWSEVTLPLAADRSIHRVRIAPTGAPIRFRTLQVIPAVETATLSSTSLAAAAGQ